MNERTHVAHRLAVPHHVFRDRLDAGAQLAAYLAARPDTEAVVFALPRGGVPVARPIADALRCPLRPLLVRKLPIPAIPEMGFGAVTLDGTVALNERVVRDYYISESDIDAIVAEVTAELQRRAGAYPGGREVPQLRGRHVFLVDDGLATGYTALAAAEMLAAREPAVLTLAVPCAPSSSLRLLAPTVSATYCLYEQLEPPFAVASFYDSFPDVTDDEVRDALTPSTSSAIPS